MDRNQQYVSSLMERVPKWELREPDHQTTFDRIKDTLSNASDLQSQLKSLYKVSGFSDVALGLMWIIDKAGADPSRIEPTVEEENLILGLLKKAFGEDSPSDGFASLTSGEQPLGFDAAVLETGVPQPEVMAESPTQELSSSESVDLGSGAAPPQYSGGSPEVSEQDFSATLEKLLEAIQSGSDERTVLLEQLSGQAEGIVASQASNNDYKTFCGYLIEFLKYVSLHQLFDDIRVMNMLSNIYDPFSQWARTDASGRAGMLVQTNEILRDFKALFE